MNILARLCVCIFAVLALAASPPAPNDNASIAGNTFHNAGAIRVNQAAGSGNVQANTAAVVGPNAKFRLSLVQTAGTTGSDVGHAAVAGFAFADAAGLLQVNQSAGAGNAQGNAALVRYGATPAELDDAALGAALPTQHTSPATRPSTGGNAVSNAPTAFSHAAGIVQINQSAGNGNSTANTLLLQVQQNAATH
jgi:hypothetical protein